jgi:hypothetical protein
MEQKELKVGCILIPPMARANVTPASARTWTDDLVRGGPTRASSFPHASGALRNGARMTGILAAASSFAA